ncbi:MAG: hypothetical protein HY650_05500 [Acidobacteria bacterium]|nr:hypothetical protein [Acidobacteriota bacterium]
MKTGETTGLPGRSRILHSAHVRTRPRGAMMGSILDRPMLQTWKRTALLASLMAVAAACRPPVRIPTAIDGSSLNRSGRGDTLEFTLEATAITDEDSAYQTFDANPILARLLVVKAKLRNRSTQSLVTREASWELEGGSGLRFEQLSPMKALDRLYSYYGVRTYAKHSRKAFRKRFDRLGIDLDEPFPPAGEREGLLFFQIPEALDPLGPLPPLRLRLSQISLPGGPARGLDVEIELIGGV